LVACILHAAMLFSPFNMYLYTSAFKVILFISFPIIYYKFIRGERFLNYIFVKGDKRNTKLAFLLGLGVFAFLWGAFFVLRPFIDSEMITYALEANGITADNFHFVFIYIVLINAFLEQFFFRGFVFGTIYREGFKKYAHLYSGVLFSVYHIPIMVGGVSFGILMLSVVGLVVAGLIFSFMMVKCKNIWGSLIVHVSANFALNLIVVYNLNMG